MALGNYRPTDQAYEAFEHLSGKIQTQLDRFGQLIESEIPQLNSKIAAAGLGAVEPRVVREPTEAEVAEAAQPASPTISGMEGSEGSPTVGPLGPDSDGSV